jgi:hypothetical protein
MAISTTDVITNVVSGIEIIKNGTAIVYCGRGVPVGGSGNYEALVSQFEYNKSYSYTDIESKYTNRFDDVAYFFTGSGNS